MSTNVSLVGIDICEDTKMPRVYDFREEMGFSNLLLTLESVAKRRPDLLVEVSQRVMGLRQFYVKNVPGLLTHIQENQEFWDVQGFNFQAGIELMAYRPTTHWWFHVET